MSAALCPVRLEAATGNNAKPEAGRRGQAAADGRCMWGDRGRSRALPAGHATADRCLFYVVCCMFYAVDARMKNEIFRGHKNSVCLLYLRNIPGKRNFLGEVAEMATQDVNHQLHSDGAPHLVIMALVLLGQASDCNSSRPKYFDRGG